MIPSHPLTPNEPSVGEDRCEWDANSGGTIVSVNDVDAFRITDSLGTVNGQSIDDSGPDFILVLFPRVIVGPISAMVTDATAVDWLDGGIIAPPLSVVF